MPMTFSFNKFSANKKILDSAGIKINDSNWTWKDFLSIAQKLTVDKNGDGTLDQYAFPKMSSQELFSYIYNMEYYKFIDYDKKTASFDSKDFTDILKLTAELSGKKICSPELDISKLWEMKDSGTVAFITQYFSDYQNMLYAKALSNGDVEILNYPSSDGATDNSKIFTVGKAFAINNNSQVKSEAWEFIKLLLSDEVQGNPDLYEYAVNLHSQKEKAQKALSQSAGISDVLKTQNGRDVKPLSQSDIDLMDKMIGQLSELPYSDPQVDKIISDTTEEFFSGNRTAEETGKLIQSKVSTYLGE